MKSHFLFLALPALVLSAPEAEPKPVPEPQLQALIPLAIGGGLTLGALGLGAAAVGSGLSSAARDCECARGFQPPPCSSSWCECKNQASIACWASRNQQCKISLSVCAANGGTSGSPTGLNSEYPPCGQGLPSCSNGKVCRKLDNACSDSRGGGSCIGLCVPPVTAPKAQQPQQQQPWQRPGQGAAPKGPPKCPANFACPQNTVCVIDPHDTLAQLRGPSYKCVDNMGICGGFQNQQCRQEQLCVPDPRITCSGNGCTGICA